MPKRAKTRRADTGARELGKMGTLAAPDLKRAIGLAMELMAIEGRSGQEGAVAMAVEGRLRRAGAKGSMLRRDAAHRRTPIRGQSGNLILKVPGTVRGPRRMFSAHLDTVPICVGCKPVRKGRMIHSAALNTGLGADDRAGAAVILTAAREILQRDLPHPPLTFCWFVQEETGLHGSRLVNRAMLGKAKLAFNWDGGAPEKLTVGATGGYRLEIRVRGVASHAGGAPELGVSAIAIAGLAIADLQQGGWHGLIRKARREGTSNIGVIQGGEATNVVTNYVLIRAEARSHDPEFRKRIVREIEKAFVRAARKVKNTAGKMGQVECLSRLDYESFRLDHDQPCVLAAEAAVRAVGRTPMLAVANGGVDANWLVKHGIPTVTLGCGQRRAHMIGESLDVHEFEDACRMALLLATAQKQNGDISHGSG